MVAGEGQENITENHLKEAVKGYATLHQHNIPATVISIRNNIK